MRHCRLPGHSQTRYVFLVQFQSQIICVFQKHFRKVADPAKRREGRMQVNGEECQALVRSIFQRLVASQFSFVLISPLQGVVR